jgi:hypothetical protein
MKTKITFLAFLALISELSFAGLPNSKTYPLNTYFIVLQDIVVPAKSKSLNLDVRLKTFPNITKIKSCELTYEAAQITRRLRKDSILPTNGVEIQQSDLTIPEIKKFISELGGVLPDVQTREKLVKAVFSIGGILKMKSGEDLQIRIPILASNGGDLGRAIQCKLYGEVSSPEEVVPLIQESLTEITPNDLF